MEHISTIVEIVVLLSTGIIALDKILEICGKPFTKLDARHKHKKEMDNKFTTIENQLEEIKVMNKNQNEQIEMITNGQLNLLRNNIQYIYDHHKDKRQLHEGEREQLDELFEAYAQEGGNGHYAKLYNRMTKWNVTPDDYEE